MLNDAKIRRTWRTRLHSWYTQIAHKPNTRCMLMIVGWAVMSLLTLLWLSYQQTQIVVYNSQHTITLFSAQMAKTKLPQKQIEALSKRFSAMLEKTVDDYARENHVVILKPSAVIVAQDDITPYIEARLARNMQEANE